MVRWVVNILFAGIAVSALISFISNNNLNMIALMVPYILFQLLETFLLLTNKRPVKGASSWQEIVIPVLGAGWPIIASLLLKPTFADIPYLLLVLGLVALSLIYLIEFLTLLTIWYSFSILPEARTIVKTGLYRYIRHPLYTLYFLWAGLNVLLTLDITYFIFGMLPLVVFLSVRARLEEKKLLEHLHGYKDYMEETGMFFPKLKFYSGSVSSPDSQL